MPAHSPVKKERVGLGGSRMGTKENNITKEGRRCSWECFEKIETYCYSEIFFFLEILINVKAGSVKEGTRKVYHGHRVGQACSTVLLMQKKQKFFESLDCAVECINRAYTDDHIYTWSHSQTALQALKVLREMSKPVWSLSGNKLTLLCVFGHSVVQGNGDGIPWLGKDQVVCSLVLYQQFQSHHVLVASRL
jgi:hypothetical protein